MTPLPLLDAHKGKHCPQRRPSFFRRLVRPWWRKEAAPEIPREVPGAALPARWLTESQLLAPARLADLDARVDAALRPVNGRNLGTQPRRHPDTQPIAVPAALRTIPVQPAPGRPPWDTAPWPVYGERPQLDVMARERELYFAAQLDNPRADITWRRVPSDELDREFTSRPDTWTLRRVLHGLRNLPGEEAAS